MKIPLKKARDYAEKIVEELRPMCERIEIAGSIRRQCPEVGDIDLVIEPKRGQMHAIKSRCLRGGPMVMADGDLNYLLMLVGNVQLDIFFARAQVDDLLAPKPPNFGTILLCRTGSKEHNIWMISKAKAAGVAWLPYEGVLMNGQIVASETEEEIFRMIGVEYVKPENRSK